MAAEDRLALSAPALADRLARGTVRAPELALDVLGRLSGADGLAWHDAGIAAAQSKALEEHRLRQRPLGMLHGLPVALDDRIDTLRVPTAQGLPDKDRRPEQDARLAARLRAAGAWVVGKAVPSLLMPDALPGLVARGVPLGLGIDPDGALAEAAGRAGVAALRLSHGLVSQDGVMSLKSLDAPVALAADLSGAALLADALFGDDPVAAPPPRLAAAATARPPAPPTIAFAAAPSAGAGREPHAALADLLGARAFSAALPAVFAEADVQARRVLAAEAAHLFAPASRRYGDALPPAYAVLVEEGSNVSAASYMSALDWRAVLYAGIDALLDRCDAVAFEGGAGIPAFLGLPTVTLPLLLGADGAGLGVHLAARRGDDARLVRTAAWLASTVVTSTEAA